MEHIVYITSKEFLSNSQLPRKFKLGEGGRWVLSSSTCDTWLAKLKGAWPCPVSLRNKKLVFIFRLHRLRPRSGVRMARMDGERTYWPWFATM